MFDDDQPPSLAKRPACGHTGPAVARRRTRPPRYIVLPTIGLIAHPIPRPWRVFYQDEGLITCILGNGSCSIDLFDGQLAGSDDAPDSFWAAQLLPVFSRDVSKVRPRVTRSRETVGTVSIAVITVQETRPSGVLAWLALEHVGYFARLRTSETRAVSDVHQAAKLLASFAAIV